MKSSNHLVLSVLLLMVLVFINGIMAEKNMTRSKTYKEFCEASKCTSACKSENYLAGK
ncbi:hypothetical protein ACP275_11G101500 [Erythranthe tilingii]